MTSLFDQIFTWWGQVRIEGPMTLAAAIQAVAAIVGFPVVIYQLFQLRRNILGATQDKLYAHYTEICKAFMEHPELRPYFYSRKQMGDCNQQLASKIEFMCELIMGLVEHAVLQKKNVPRDTWTNCWRPYAVERLERSEVLEKYFDPNAHWYSREMRCEMEAIKRDLNKKKRGRPDTTQSQLSKNIEFSEMNLNPSVPGKGSI